MDFIRKREDEEYRQRVNARALARRKKREAEDPSEREKRLAWHRQHRQREEVRTEERVRVRVYGRKRTAEMTEEERAARNAAQRAKSTGWTEDRVCAAWQAQGGRCAICAFGLDRADRKIGCIGDHYETVDGVRVRTSRKKITTKHPRALLCQSCNSGLGHYEAIGVGQRARGLHIQPYEDYIAKYGG